MDASDYFKGKKITVMGIDPEGRGVQDALFLAQCGALVTVTDLKKEEELGESVARLRAYPTISFTLGEHTLEDFRDKDLIVRAASVPLGSPYLEEARQSGIDIKTDETLFLAYAPQLVTIGITGTRGKSTVTELIYAVLQAAGKRSFIGGNVRGKATLPLLAEVQTGDMVVLELDSWKLQGFGEAEISPHIAVFTTFYQDHLNYYKNDMGAYLADKAKIFLHQSADDVLILGKQCAPAVIEKYGELIESKTVVVDEQKLPSDWTLRMPGQHNRYNAALALAALRALDISDEVIRETFATFAGVPGRLELIRERDGITVYNDNNSTTPEATLAALSVLNPAHTVLILGGSDKNLDMNKLLIAIRAVKRVILLAGTGTDRVLEFIEGASVFDNLEQAVKEAFAAASPGDTILFSPAFASFGMFKNEYDRGDQFTELVKNA